MSERRPALLDPPAWLNDAQREIWTDAIAAAPRGLLKAVDSGVLAAFVVAADVHRQAHDQIEALGMLWWRPEGKGPSAREFGKLVPSPAVAVESTAATLMLTMAIALGFTPASRTKIRGQA